MLRQKDGQMAVSMRLDQVGHGSAAELVSLTLPFSTMCQNLGSAYHNYPSEGLLSDLSFETFQSNKIPMQLSAAGLAATIPNESANELARDSKKTTARSQQQYWH